MATRKTKIELLLDALSDDDWHWGDELAAEVGWRFGATIKVARYKGYSIETERVGLKHRYRLLQASVV